MDNARMNSLGSKVPPLRTGWTSRLARFSMALLWVEALSGLAITFSPFHAAVQWTVIVHTVAGAVMLLPLAWYCGQHWLDYRRYAVSHIVVLGYVGLAALLVCALSGVVLTWQGFFELKMTPWLRQTHLYSTFVVLLGILPHVVFSFLRVRRTNGNSGAAAPAATYPAGVSPALETAGETPAGLSQAGRLRHYPASTSFRFFGVSFAATLVAGAIVAALTFTYSGTKYNNVFPKDYSFLYGTNRPFAPSLARTDTGGAFDAHSLAGSRTCGTAGCHEQIVEEWKPSAHRYAAMDTVFLGIQNVMAQQNGAESTRYCGGCHDPISLFSGTKNIFVENLTGLHGYQEGVSCMACHAIRETDVKGNANYTVTQPHEYLWQWATNGVAQVARDFLIRTYPDEHNRLGKRSFKKPEYCAACHKQFIDAEVNRVGWVQLQNQYDNWAASHWNHKGDARKTVECRECHMPLVDSRDPAAGDAMDYNRQPGDKKHRSHRFIAANTIIPYAQSNQLEGWKTQFDLTEQWLKGNIEVPEIRDKWAHGPIVKVSLTAPPSVAPGENIPLRVVMASNKVGHDFPTGPLDIIQSWLEVTVTDDAGRTVFTSGKRDAKHFIQPGSFLFKAEPVDQHGNLIDRHNLWEMVGVRYRRALFPGYSDTVQYSVPCSGALAHDTNAPAKQVEDKLELQPPKLTAPAQAGKYQINVALQYRKVDQFLLNFLFGETNKLTSPVTEIARATATVVVKPKETAKVAPDERSAALTSAR